MQIRGIGRVVEGAGAATEDVEVVAVEVDWVREGGEAGFLDYPEGPDACDVMCEYDARGIVSDVFQILFQIVWLSLSCGV